MNFELKPATRTSVKPLICFYGESGSGKTYSALLLARGLVGPTGKIAMIDTESGRGSLYADVLPGGYDVLQIMEPFSPERAIEAIQFIEKSGAKVGIIDSASHFWEGIGGVCDQADQNETKSGKPGLHNWRAPKMGHQKFVLKLLQSSLPWIICLRAKFKTRQTKDGSKTAIVKDDYPTPIQDEGFIYETTCHGLIDGEHHFHLKKSSHPDLRRCMPNNELTTTEHGKRLAEWCASPGGPGTGKQNGNGKGELLSKLRAMTVEIHGWTTGMSPAEWQSLKPKLEAWLMESNIISDTQTMGELTTEELAEVIEQVTLRLQPPTP